MELCPMCAAQVHERDVYCARCGAPLRDDSAALGVAARELARPRDGAGTDTWGIFLSIGLALSALGAFASLFCPLALFEWFGWAGVVLGGVSFLYDVALAALFDAVIDLRKKARRPLPPSPLPPPLERSS